MTTAQEQRQSPLTDDECNELVRLVGNGIHIDQAFRTLGMTYMKWDNSSDPIKKRIRKAVLDFQDSLTREQKREAIEATEILKTKGRSAVVRTLPVAQTTSENELVLQTQITHILVSMTSRMDFENQMEQRLSRLVEHRIITQEQRGKLEFCLTGIFITINGH